MKYIIEYSNGYNVGYFMQIKNPKQAELTLKGIKNRYSHYWQGFRDGVMDCRKEIEIAMENKTQKSR